MNDQWTDRLSEYLDGELGAEESHQLEEHLEGCESCQGILSELKLVLRRAHSLPDQAPRPELWDAIVDAIEEHPVEIPEPRRGKRPVRRADGVRRTVSLPLPQLVAACLAVMVLSAAVGWFARPGGLQPETGVEILAEEGQSSAVELEPMNDELWRESGNEVAAVRWEEAVRDQELVYRQMVSQIDTTTVRVLEKNLGLLDRSIDEIREARDEDPENPLWNNRLADNLRRKLRLLRWASSISTRET